MSQLMLLMASSINTIMFTFMKHPMSMGITLMTQTIIICLITNNMFTIMKHPMSMGITLMTQTIIICLITNNMSYNAWFSYILFLVFLGGMLVLFIYMTSVASNELFEKNNNLLMGMVSTVIIILIFMDPALLSNATDEFLKIEITESKNSMMMLFNYPTSILTTMAVMYLFLTLIVVVKMTELYQGPLRSN
uniref:NADH-ubiquinone oxidoreductase chain 6 n=1 Tax=Platycnemis foliacea TaxID=1041950 RepID=A0A0F7J3S4_9ODON|nr:NADH dehydrogenase subunit 6 [Platycnemis foliacea]AKH04368.1 NADH dehydrogenase subunit 6 [Platycnemis foliacea]